MPESYAPLDGRRQAVVSVFSVIVVVSVVAVISDVLEVSLLGRLIRGENVTLAEVDANDDRQQLIGFVQFAALVTGATVFIRWMHRAYQNVDVVDAAERRYGHGWAIGSWFVPILNLWRPKQIVNDIWRAGGDNAADKEPGGLLLSWWTLWIVGGVASQVAIRLWFGGDTPEEIRGSSIAWAVSDGIDVVTAILAVLIVRAATDRLDGRAAALSSPGPDDGGGEWTAPERPAGVSV
jgi:hypothetical protein